MKITNPVLTGFHADPSMIRVKDTYYIANSTFEWFPGIRLHESKDMVHWNTLPYPLGVEQLDMRGDPASGGVWAPDLSYADGRFWIVYSDVHIVNGAFKDVVNYLTTAEDIRGPWSKPLRLNGVGFDASLFHDDGRKYLVQQTWDHREYKHQFHGITLTEFDTATMRLKPETARTIWMGDDVKLVEGPHLYKINGWYYLFCAEGGTVWTHQESVARSRTLDELSFEASPTNPFITNFDTPGSYLQKQGHGALVDTPSGEWYYASLCGRPWHHETESFTDPRGWCTLGRETSIQKVEWAEDGWPYIVGGHGGERYVEAPKDAIETVAPASRDQHDEFDADVLGLDWNTLRVPFDEKMGSVGGGSLKLIGQGSLCNTFDLSLVARRWQAFDFDAETCVAFDPKTYQAMAGLTNYYNDQHWSWAFVTYDEDRKCRVIEVAQNDRNNYTSFLRENAVVVPEGVDRVWLRAKVRTQWYAYEYSFDGETWTELPASSWWMIRGDRLSNPCALAVTRSRVVGVVSSPYLVDRGDGMLVGHEACDELPFVQYAGFSCMLPTPGIVPCDDHASVGVTIGYENAPWLFVSSTDIRERPDSAEGPITLAPGGAAIMRLDVVDAPARDGRAIIPVLETVYRRFHEPPRQVGAPARAIRDIAVAVDRDAWLEDEHMYAGFVFDHHSPGDEIIEGKPYMYRRLGSSSWTNGMASAVPMLASAWRLGDDAMRRHALDGIEHIIQHCINPTNGLPYTAVEHERWSNRGWWFDGLSNPGHSGYLVGQTMYSALRAWQIERRFGGIDHSDWLKIIGNVIPRLAAGRNAVGEYPFVFDEMDGSGAEYESFGGVWCLAASAYWALLTGDHSDLDGMLLSERHYHDRYVAHMECYGAPLDTSKAVDSEGILGYIKAVGCLYAITGDAMYLDRMREAFAYECSFRFCWNSPVGVPPLNEVGWSSCGGSVTSTSNAHIHPMSSVAIEDMVYYLRYRNDTYIASRLCDAVGWSCQTYNLKDGEYGYGRVGWMSERFCHCQGFLDERYPDGSLCSTWRCLMPWAAGAILDGLTGLYWDVMPHDELPTVTMVSRAMSCVHDEKG